MNKPCRIEVIDGATAAMYRAMTPAARVALAARAHQTARVLIAAGVRAQFPNWPEADVAREVARRLSGGTT